MLKYVLFIHSILLFMAEQGNAQQSYVLATEQGLFRIDARGRVEQKLSKTQAYAPRYLRTPTCTSIVFLHNTNDGAIEARQLGIAAGREESIATLSPFYYSDFNQSGNKAEVRLEPQDESDILVGETGMCIHMMDRNFNMAQYEASVQIDFTTRKVQVLSLGCQAEGCKLGLPFLGHLSSNCQVGKSNQCSRWVGESKNRYPFRIKQQKLVEIDSRGKERRVASLKDRSNWGWQEWGPASRSGRWQLLQGNLEDDTDSLFRQALMLDRKTGLLYPIPLTESPQLGQQLPWPRPLSRTQLGTIHDPASLRTLSLSSTSHLRTLYLEDQILVDAWLVSPGKYVMYLGGDLAY